jgi:aspartyl-tRNA(Asn)/glutamyl-tRNA(Gln) amidotransferase subunit C
MTIDGDTVDHVALLARLALSTEERERLREQLSAILEHINVISEADTSQVPATAHILPLENIMRTDRAVTWSSPRELIENAPSHEASYIRVRAVRE